MSLRHSVMALVALALIAPGLALAQDQGADRAKTLADIRQELSVLYVTLQRLKRELSTTGATASDLSQNGTMLERVSAIESALQDLTAKTERLEHRVDQIVIDGTNRIGDLEFRLCDLEKTCDPAKLGQGTTLGGGDLPDPGGVQPLSDSKPDSSSAGPELAVDEKADFDRAKKAYESGDYVGAAQQFADFRKTYPGGPLSSQAGLMRGKALEKADRMTDAARAYLDTFSAAPAAAEAPEALYRLGRALGDLGQTKDACVTLAQVGARYPDAAAVTDARATMQALGCS